MEGGGFRRVWRGMGWMVGRGGWSSYYSQLLSIIRVLVKSVDNDHDSNNDNDNLIHDYHHHH